MPIPPKNQAKTGYLLPSTNDVENCCICVPVPLERGHLRAFLGQISELAKWQTWQKDGTTSASEAARRWSDIVLCVAESIENAMANDCGCGSNSDQYIYRHNPETDRLERSLDGGEHWENDPADPRYNSPVFAPQEGETEDDVKCLSATNAVVFFKDELIGQAGDWTTLTTVIAGILAVLIGLLTGGLGAALVIELASTFINVGIATAVAAFDDDVYERFKCNLYCNALDNGSWDEAALVRIKAQIDVDETATANTILKSWIDQLGTVGLTNSGRVHLENDADCSGCDCAFTCGDEGLITYGTVIEAGEEAGHKYLIIQSVHIPDAGGFQAVVQNTYGNTSPPATLCYVSSWEVTAGYGGSLVTAWTGASGDVHEPSNPAMVLPGVAHFYFATPAGNDTPFTIKIVY